MLGFTPMLMSHKGQANSCWDFLQSWQDGFISREPLFMTSIQHIRHQSEPVCTDLIQMIRQGMILRLKRFVVEPYDDGEIWAIQTVAIATPDTEDGDHFPVVIANLHDDVQAAMSFALNVFDALKSAGRASGEDVCLWRRSLFTLVPNY